MSPDATSWDPNEAAVSRLWVGGIGRFRVGLTRKRSSMLLHRPQPPLLGVYVSFRTGLLHALIRWTLNPVFEFGV